MGAGVKDIVLLVTVRIIVKKIERTGRWENSDGSFDGMMALMEDVDG